MELYEHQEETLDLHRRSETVFDTSDPGTGKTLPTLHAFVERRRDGGGKALVLAPKSILQATWGDEIDKFFPGVRYSVAYASNRKKAFQRDVDIYITNHDAIKWIIANLPKSYFNDFDTLIVDEITAYKHSTSQRSRAVLKAAPMFEYRVGLTGTPNPNTITDVWHQLRILDGGNRLGTSYWRFRNQVCRPVQSGPGINHVRWVDKPGASEAVYDLLRDITVRHRFEDCVDIPPNHTYAIEFALPPKLSRQYQSMIDNAAIQLEDGKVITSVHASALNQKLLQISAGAIYDSSGEYEVLDDTRTELIMDLLEPRAHTVVAYIWKHQRNLLLEAAERRGYSYAYIGGDVGDHERADIVNNFQSGQYKVLFIHPQSAGHGLTLTKGTTTIWASPTYNAEHYKQVGHRIYRQGQTEKTETIWIIAKGTIDEIAYKERLNPKLTKMDMFLSLFEEKTDGNVLQA